MLFLAVAWEAYGSFLDNPLLFPTFHDTSPPCSTRSKTARIPLRAWASLKVLSWATAPARGVRIVIVIGLIVENLIFRTIERNTVQKWGTQS